MTEPPAWLNEICKKCKDGWKPECEATCNIRHAYQQGQETQGRRYPRTARNAKGIRRQVEKGLL